MNFKKFALSMLGGCLLSAGVSAQVIKPESKILVAYFSQTGNTRTIAQKIQQELGADIFEITPNIPYVDDYNQLVEKAKKEIADGVTPSLRNKVANFADYDIIFVGSPCWWGTIASPVRTFLTEYDFSGKTVIPFMTHGGSGLGHSVDDIKTLVPAAKVTGAESFWGRFVGRADVSSWLNNLKSE